MKNKIIILIIFFGILSQTAKAQYQDLEGLYSIGAKMKLNKSWSFGLKEELRFNSNSLKLDKHFTDLQINLKHTKWLKYGFGARYYFNKLKNDNWESALRINIDILLKFKYEKFTFLSRTRLQSSLNPKNTVGRLHSNEALLREKITVNYNLKKYKIKPFISGEIFLEDYFEFAEKAPVMKLRPNKYRLYAGVDWKVNKRHFIKFSYGYQQELNQVFDKSDFLVSVKYTYKIILKNKK